MQTEVLSTSSNTNTFQSENDFCQVCKSDRYLNPHIRLLVSPCFHKLCDACIDRLFTHGPAPCPICQVTLRKNNFVLQTFEDLVVEKEVQIRKKVCKLFNKRQEDFKSLREFNDYLEEVEEIIFNLINNVDVQETNERIEKFRQENQNLIAINQSKQQRDIKAELFQLEQEKQERKMLRDAFAKKEIEDFEAKKNEKESLLEELATSTKTASDILAKRSKNGVSGAKEGDEMKYLSANKAGATTQVHSFEDEVDEGAEQDSTPFDPYQFVVDTTTRAFPVEKRYVDKLTESYFTDKASLASGYSPMYMYERAIGAAFSGLFEPVV